MELNRLEQRSCQLEAETGDSAICSEESSLGDVASAQECDDSGRNVANDEQTADKLDNKGPESKVENVTEEHALLSLFLQGPVSLLLQASPASVAQE